MLELLEIRAQREGKRKEAASVMEAAIAEERELTEAEEKKVKALEADIKSSEANESRYLALHPEKILAKTEPIKESPAEVHEIIDPKGGFRYFGEYLYAIKYNRNDPRLVALRTGGKEGDDTVGGYLVPTEFSNRILMNSLEASVMRAAKAAVGSPAIPMGSDSLSIPKIKDTAHSSNVFGGVVAYWTEETGTITGSQPTFDSIKLIAKKLAGYTYASNELLNDSAAGLAALLEQMFGAAIAWYEDAAFIGGNGVGKPLGILNSGSLLALNRSAATTVAAADIASMWARFGGNRQRAVWFLNATVLAQLIKLTTTPITWVRTKGATPNVADPTPQEIMGRPYYVTEHCKALGTAGDIVLLDPAYYLIGERQSISIATSEHVRFTTDETAWRFTERLDGQPWVDNKFTPANGSTLSPFVTLYTATTGGD